jgi:hypothetical protein
MIEMIENQITIKTMLRRCTRYEADSLSLFTQKTGESTTNPDRI